MPVMEIVGIDEEPVYDGSPSFQAGMVSNQLPSLIDPSAAALMVNCDLNRFGSITTRRGTSTLGGNGITPSTASTTIQGMINFQTPTYNYMVAVQSAKLWQFDGTNWVQIAAAFTGAGPDVTVAYSLAVGIDRLYWVNGTDHLYSWTGAATADLGGATNAHPPNAPKFILWFTSRLVAGGMTAEGDALYFSKILDGATWDRTWWQLRVGGGEGDPITGIAPWLDFNLVVLKQHSIWLVNCDPAQIPSTDANQSVSWFVVKPIHKRIGCVAPKTAAQVGSDIFFLSTDGVRSVARTVAAETQQDVGDALSSPVQDIIERINPAYIDKSTATFYNNRYILSVPIDTATEPNYTLVFNTLTQSWSGYWTGWTPKCFGFRVADSGPARLNIGQSNGTVIEFLDYIQLSSEVASSFQDSGAAIPTRVLTRAYTCGDLFSPKTGFRSEFEFNRSNASVSIGYLLDEYPSSIAFDENPIASSSGAGYALPLVLPFTLPNVGSKRVQLDLMRAEMWRTLQFEFNTSSGKLALGSLGLSAWIESYLAQL